MLNIRKMTAGRFWSLAAAGCLIYLMSNGLRTNFGMLLPYLSESGSLSYAYVSFVMAAGQLIYGLAQPLFGVLAVKRSYREVLNLGAVLMLLGLITLPFAQSKIALFLALGVCAYAGSGALCFGLVVSALSPVFGKGQAALFSGLLNAAAGVGSCLFSPLLALLLADFDFGTALFLTALPLIALLPIAGMVSRARAQAAVISECGGKLNVRAALSAAAHHRGYILLTIAFTTCGFHMGIIYTHLYSEMLSYQLPGSFAAGAYTLLGAAVIAGALLCAAACSRWRCKQVLGYLYMVRAAAAVLYVIAPKNETSTLLFCLVLGLSCDATVAPTSEVVSRWFGPVKLALLFGVAYIFHQLGSFASAVLGGYLIAVYGSYSQLWLVDAVLCMGAALLCFILNENAPQSRPGMLPSRRRAAAL